MAIAVGSVSNTPTYGTRTNSTITAPSSIANGDLLVAVLHAGNSSGTAVTVTPPAGFTEVTNSPIAETFSGYTIASHVYYKVASGESGNYTFSHSSADTEGYMYRLTGADTSTPIDVTPATAVANLVNNGTTTELATITTVTNGAFIIAQDSAWDAPGAGNWSGTTPTLTTRRTGSISKLADGTLATAGATGARTRTNGNTGGGNLPWVSIIVAIRPATASNKTLDANAGSYAVGGTAATLKLAKRTAANSGSYSLTGTAATLKRTLKTAANSGSYALTGQTASFARSWRVTANSGSYGLSGTAAALKLARRASANSGSYSISGAAATLKLGKAVVAGAGAYSTTGSPASLAWVHKIAAASGTYSLTGSDATLTKSSSKVLVLDSGSYVLTGSSASLKKAGKIAASADSYNINGTAASLIRFKGIAAQSGSYSITGSNVTLAHAVIMSPNGGQYTINGFNAQLKLSGNSGGIGKAYGGLWSTWINFGKDGPRT